MIAARRARARCVQHPAAARVGGRRPTSRADGHVMVDFGDDALTQGRAHPMIDPRCGSSGSPTRPPTRGCGVVLLDVVLGHGAHPDPAAVLAPAIAAAVAAAAPGRSRARRRRLAVRHRRRPAGPARRPRRWRRPARRCTCPTPRPPGRRRSSSGGRRDDACSTEPAGRRGRRQLFADALADQAVAGDPVDWRPPLGDAGTEAGPRPGAGRPAARRGQRAPRWSGCWPPAPSWSTSGRRPRRSGSSRDSSCTPGRRSAGSARPARCAAR